MGEVMGIDFKGLDNDRKKESFINYLKDLKKACGMDNNLNVSITDKEISELAANTIKDPCIVTNPRMPSVENMWRFLKMPSDTPEEWLALREKIIGLGEKSIKKLLPRTTGAS